MAVSVKEKFTETTTEDLAAQVEALKADIAALTHSLGDYGRTQGAHLAETARESAKSARSSGEAELEHLRSKVNDLSRQAEDFVAHKPGVALGVAAGLGFLAGLVLSRR